MFLLLTHKGTDNPTTDYKACRNSPLLDESCKTFSQLSGWQQTLPESNLSVTVIHDPTRPDEGSSFSPIRLRTGSIFQEAEALAYPWSPECLHKHNFPRISSPSNLFDASRQPSDSTGDPSFIVSPCEAERARKTLASTGEQRWRLSDTAKAIFNAYFAENPYPEKEELVNLSSRTGLTGKTWFTNKRSRTTPSAKEANASGPSTMKEVCDSKPFSAGAQAAGSPKLTRSSLDCLNEEYEQSDGHDTLKRFLSSPLDENPVKADVIEQAARQSPLPNIERRPNKLQKTRRTGSVHSGKSSGASIASGRSYGSLGSVVSVGSRSSRRDRRNVFSTCQA